MAVDKFYDHYKNRGYSFDKELLTTYCLSLYTKPLVILSGISGTGKTKIAQFFNTALDESLSQTTTSRATITNNLSITLTVTKGMTSGDGRANFRYNDLPVLLDPTELNQIENEIQRLANLGVDDNIGDNFHFEIEAPDGTLLPAIVYLQRARNPLVRVRFKSRKNEPEYDSTTYFTQHYPVGTVLELEKIGARRLKIISVNGVQASAMERQRRNEDLSKVKNSCFVSVKSDWTDPTPLLGYYNFIEQRYHLAPVLEFILKAQENPEIPFFLILDEMNLAKVEHYFSDFLSCLESRHSDNGTIYQEPIHLHAQSGLVETNNSYYDVIEPAIEIPTNLYVTGTVNVDESTYMFSPKVLDRANVIELNQVDIVNYPNVSSNNQGLVLSKLPDFTSLHLPSADDYVNTPDSAKSFLKGIHKILEAHNLHFGYRVINEISKYVINTMEFCGESAENINRALDLQASQKILPKLNGPENKLEDVIDELLQFLSENGPTREDDQSDPTEFRNTKFPLTTEKLARLKTSLSVNGYASFIE